MQHITKFTRNPDKSPLKGTQKDMRDKKESFKSADDDTHVRCL